jgi:hypothetical protein
MASVDCHRLLGATLSHWLEQNRLPIALLFTLTILIAQSMVRMLLRSLAGSMGGGSHLICLGHSRASPTAATGKTKVTQ